MQKIGVFEKIGKFLKRNAYYVLLIACIAAVGTMVTLTVINESAVEVQGPSVNNPDNGGNGDLNVDVTPGGNDKPIEDVVVKPDPKPEVIVFSSPVQEITGTKEYAMDTLVFSQTNNQWECHDGIDYFAAAGTSVTAVYGGTVESVNSDALHGNVVTVNHGDGLVTVYANLGEVSVKAGDSLDKGEVIGTVGNSGLVEIADGDHLHFETILNGENVDPTAYFAESDK